MILERYRTHVNRPIKRGKSNRKGHISRSKSRMLEMARKRKPIDSPQLRESYSTKVEWARKLIPKLKKEEALKGKEA